MQHNQPSSSTSYRATNYLCQRPACATLEKIRNIWSGIRMCLFSCRTASDLRGSDASTLYGPFFFRMRDIRHLPFFHLHEKKSPPHYPSRCADIYTWNSFTFAEGGAQLRHPTHIPGTYHMKVSVSIRIHIYSSSSSLFTSEVPITIRFLSPKCSHIFLVVRGSLVVNYI